MVYPPVDPDAQRNLAKNGGLLDEVIWLQRTHDRADLAFLDRLINSEPDYKRVKVKITEKAFASAYDTIEDDILYIKVDTDIVRDVDETLHNGRFAHLRVGFY